MSDSKEDRSWEFAAGMNTVSAYQGYLYKYPSGEHRREARRRIVRKRLRIALFVVSFIVMISLAAVLALEALRSVANHIG